VYVYIYPLTVVVVVVAFVKWFKLITVTECSLVTELSDIGDPEVVPWQLVCS
jgi:hypothetical protein